MQDIYHQQQKNPKNSPDLQAMSVSLPWTRNKAYGQRRCLQLEILWTTSKPRILPIYTYIYVYICM